MIKKESWLSVNDSTNIRWVKVFHLYKGFLRRQTKPGFYIKGSARVVEPPRIEYKGFKYKYSIKGDICRMFLVRSNYKLFSKSNFYLTFTGNTGFIIKKKNDAKSKFIYGPISRLLNRKKVLTLFKTVL